MSPPRLPKEAYLQDYYAALGVASDATPEQVKAAFKQLGKDFHPDATAGNKAAEDRFKAATDAYSILKDPRLRAEYDAVRASAPVEGWQTTFERELLLVRMTPKFGFAPEPGLAIREAAKRTAEKVGPDPTPGERLDPNVERLIRAAKADIARQHRAQQQRAGETQAQQEARVARDQARSTGSMGTRVRPGGDGADFQNDANLRLEWLVEQLREVQVEVLKKFLAGSNPGWELLTAAKEYSASARKATVNPKVDVNPVQMQSGIDQLLPEGSKEWSRRKAAEVLLAGLDPVPASDVPKWNEQRTQSEVFNAAVDNYVYVLKTELGNAAFRAGADARNASWADARAKHAAEPWDADPAGVGL